MAKITGFGGIFLKCRNLEITRTWYARHLGLEIHPWGAMLDWKQETHDAPYSMFSFFPADTDYLKPSTSPFMINFRVDDLDTFVARLRAEEVELCGEPIAGEYGKFAWVMDPEGNKVELWEQPR
ncbi:MAG TPA: VOC family protein [Saprospiraceae bacterium]|nr:VOC family protein [Saprospiraceae bacterium]HNG91087.1 VOC family protein [Saprospiraceae bacterium]